MGQLQKLKLDFVQLCETQIEGSLEYDTDMLPGSYPHRKYMVCVVQNII